MYVYCMRHAPKKLCNVICNIFSEKQLCIFFTQMFYLIILCKNMYIKISEQQEEIEELIFSIFLLLLIFLKSHRPAYENIKLISSKSVKYTFYKKQILITNFNK